MSDKIDKLEGVELARKCAEAMGAHLSKAGALIKRPGDRNWSHWCPNYDANHAREMVGTLDKMRERFLFNQAMGTIRPVVAFTAPLEIICKAFLKAKAGAGVKP